MTEKELRAWMRRESLNDAWFVSVGEGEVDPSLMTLTEIYERYNNSSRVRGGKVLVLHQSQQSRKQPAWVELDLNSFEAETFAAKSDSDSAAPSSGPAGRPASSRGRRKKRRARGLAIQIGVLIAILVIGWAVWYGATREAPEMNTAFLGEEEAQALMLARLQRNIERSARGTQENEAETIRTVVSATQHMLMVKNSNLEPWENFKLKIITPKGKEYLCQFNEEIPAYSTLSISMRKIMTKGGEYLQRNDLSSGTIIELEVPGYQKWSSKL